MRQPSPRLPDHRVVGHEDVVEEHLVEHGGAGELAQRSDVDALGVHVDNEVGDAGVLGGVRVRAGQADSVVGLHGQRRPDLLAVEDPPALDRLGPGAQRGQVGPGAGLAEELAPRHRPEQGRAHPALLLLRVPWAMMVGSAQAPTARCGRNTPAAASSSSMTNWSNGSADRPHGGGQCGLSRPVSTSAARWAAPSCAATCSTRGRNSARRASASGGRSAERLRRVPARARCGHVLLEALAAGEELAGRHGPLQIEVGVVLPGEPDATENLDALLGAVGHRIEGQGAGHLCAQRPLVVGAVAAPHRGGIPRHRGALLDRDEHVGQGVLDRLELADRAAELHPHLGVVRRRVEAPPGHAGAFGRRHDEGQIAHLGRGDPGQQRVRREGDVGRRRPDPVAAWHREPAATSARRRAGRAGTSHRRPAAPQNRRRRQSEHGPQGAAGRRAAGTAPAPPCSRVRCSASASAAGAEPSSKPGR